MNSLPKDRILNAKEIKDLIYNSNSRSSHDSKTPDLENLSKFEKVENPKFPFFSRSIPKLWIVGIFACPVFVFALVAIVGGNSHKTATQILSDTSNLQVESENESLREQLDKLQVQNAILQQNFEELQTSKDKVKIVKTKPEPLAEAEIEPEPIINKPVESVKPAPQPVIDPYEEWNQYASLGVITGDGFTEEEKNLETETDTLNSKTSSPRQQNSQILAKSDVSGSIPIVALGQTDPGVGNTESYRGLENLSEDHGSLSLEAQTALFPETTYGTSFFEAKRREYKQRDTQNLNSGQQQAAESFLTRKRREYKQQDTQNLNSGQQQAAESFLARKRREYKQQDAQNLNSDRQQSTQISSAKTVELGEEVFGELSKTISWIDGEQPQIYGNINLSEDLLANDESVVLRKNSSIIVEVEIKRNGQINLQPIAISYENDRGKLVQQKIPSNTFVIQDEDNSPLIIEQRGFLDDEIPGQDAVLDLIGGRSRTARRVIREVKDINERNNSRRINTRQLKEGTKLTITVNSFLQIP